MKQKRKRSRVLLFFGTIGLVYWSIDFLNNMIYIHHPTWMLTYSSMGFFLTCIALLIENEVLIFSLFSALFIMEAVLCVDLLYTTILGKSLLGFASYVFAPDFGKRNLVFTSYHYLIPINLLVGVINSSKAYKKGWLGALGYVFFLLILSFIFVKPGENINCIHAVDFCKSKLPIAFVFPEFLRIPIWITLITVVVYIPSSYLAVWLNKKGKKQLAS